MDINLRNIVLDEDMKSFRFIDYGCCQKLPGNEREKLYKVRICGTEYYMSNEMEMAIRLGESELEYYAYK